MKITSETKSQIIYIYMFGLIINRSVTVDRQTMRLLLTLFRLCRVLQVRGPHNEDSSATYLPLQHRWCHHEAALVCSVACDFGVCVFIHERVFVCVCDKLINSRK